MSVFDLSGPDFLKFYAAFAAVVLILLHLAHRRVERGATPPLAQIDPYQIAMLRGGSHEAMRLAIVTLLDRGLLAQTDGGEIVANARASEARNQLEKETLAHFAAAKSAASVFAARRLTQACASFDAKLVSIGAFAGSRVRADRFVPTIVAVLLLAGVAGVKVVVALSRGRTNLLFLLLLCGASLFLAAASQRRKGTVRGDRLLADLRGLFSGLKARRLSIQRGNGHETEMLAAVYGVQMLPVAQFPFVANLFPQASTSSCGSSSGSSCGSSCGGGGCGGGGCGGCGG